MYVVPLRDVLEMTRLRPHGELLKARLLVKYQETLGRVLFVSHQWLAFSKPDPNFEQFRILIDALRNMVSGKVVVQKCLQDVLHHGPKCPIVDLSSEDVYTWYDYFGVPQMDDLHNEPAADSSDHRLSKSTPQDMLDAIASLPSYVHRSRFFIVLAPPCQHVDLCITCDLASWFGR